MNTSTKNTSTRIATIKSKLQQKREEIGAQVPDKLMAFDKFDKGLHNKSSWRDR